MEIALFVILFLFDCILLWLLLKGNSHSSASVETLQTIHEERRMITELHEDLKRDFEHFRMEMHKQFESIQHLATEVDHEVQSSKAILQQESENSAQQIRELIGKPLEDLSKRYVTTKKLLTRLERERETISRVITKGEKICQFLDQKIPYEELLHELEDKKYTDARALLSLGKSPKDVASTLGLTEGEVRLVAGLSVC